MRKDLLFTILTVFLTLHSLLGQTYKKVQKVVPISTNQSFYLNGGTRATFGGKSRINLMITLPANTVEWYYVFSTSPNEGSSQSLNLVAQLTRLVDPTGSTAVLTSALLTPTANGGACDIYLTDRANIDKFMSKTDNLGGSYSYKMEGTRENFKKGVVQIREITSGTWYLGFKNPSASTGVNITVEVAAIVLETTLDYTTWSEETKTTFYNGFYEHLKNGNVDDNTAKEIAGCLIDKITTQKTPEEWDKMTEGTRETFVTELANTCTEKYQPQKTEEQLKGVTFGNLGWKSYENGDIDKAIEYSKKALTIDNTLGYVKSNLGLFYLIKNKEMEATEYYVDAISDFNKDKITAKHSFEAAIDDIKQALKKYPDTKSYKHINDLLEEELKRYK
jgi:tetratricopeptide (TPR) repeat protein